MAFAADDAGAAKAQIALGRHLVGVLAALEPHCLGVYWPLRAEFNAPLALAGDEGLANIVWALPFARRKPLSLHYRRWDREEPRAVDECAIPSSDGPEVVPDVVLAPCVGYTRSGFRLGYGGGYFDRWLAAHPGACAVGVAWSIACIDEDAFVPQAHDIRLAVIVTDEGVVQ